MLLESFTMKMLSLKMTAAALITALLSTNVYAMDKDNNEYLKSSIKSAAAHGRLEVFNELLQEARNCRTFSQELLNEALRGAVIGHWLYLTADQGTLEQIHNVINQLLNMNNNGPDQKAVDSAFGDAIRSSANQDSGGLSLLQTILLDRTTNQLRTGLRPSNETIQYLRNSSYFTDPTITNFLRSLNL